VIKQIKNSTEDVGITHAINFLSSIALPEDIVLKEHLPSLNK
jgi:hypothetical protein